MVALAISDPREHELPQVGFMELEDAETGETVLIDTQDPALRARYRESRLQEGEERNRLFRSMDLDHASLSTHVSYVEPLLALFRRRERQA